MKYKVGDKVLILSERTMRMSHSMCKWLGKVMTIRNIEADGDYRMYEDVGEHNGNGWYWDDQMIVGLAQDEIHITRKGNEVIAVHKQGNKVKKTVAKCSPEDEFDFMTGAKLALKRLTEADKPKFVPHLESHVGCNWGDIGAETTQPAIFGEKLFVGDVVELYNTASECDYGRRFVASDKDTPNGFIMGVGGRKFKNGIDEEWQIRKVKSFKDLEHGEVIEGVKAVLR